MVSIPKPQTGEDSADASPFLNSFRLAIVETMQTTAQMLRYFCTQVWSFNVVFMAHNGAQGLAQMALFRPEIVLLDLYLTDTDGSDLVSAIIELLPSARIIVFASVCSDYQIHKLGRLAIHGFVDRFTEGLSNFRDAINHVGNGGTYFSTRYLQASSRLRRSETAFFKLLSDREQQVLLLIVQALSDAEIAAQLDLSVATAKTHRRKIMRKLNLPNTPKLIRYGLELGIGISETVQGIPRIKTRRQNPLTAG